MKYTVYQIYYEEVNYSEYDRHLQRDSDGIAYLEAETPEGLQEKIEHLIDQKANYCAANVLTRSATIFLNLDYYVNKQDFSSMPRGVIKFSTPILKVEIDDEEERTPEFYNKMYDDLFIQNINRGWTVIKKRKENSFQKNKEKKERELLATLKAKYE